MDTKPKGKEVSFVELYLDVVFVLAVGQLAHLIVDTPRWHTVLVTLGLFVALWWTWVGYTVLYNRHGVDDARERALFLVASAPVGTAAVAVGPASRGHIAAFAISLAAARVVLVFGYVRDDDPDSPAGDALRFRTARAFALSVVLFVVSVWIPRPLSYSLWAAAYLHESRVMLGEDTTGDERTGDGAKCGSADPSAALDIHHFAERFGLFIIILLGEVVVEAGEAAANRRSPSAAAWTGLVAAMVLAAAFWWAYFAAAADFEMTKLQLSGGSPKVARAIFAAGHIVPAFALLVAAAGVGLLLREDPPRVAYWLAAIGSAMYLTGMHAADVEAGGRRRRLLRAVPVGATSAFGAVHSLVSPPGFLWLLTAWVTVNVMVAGRTATPEKAGGRQVSEPFAGGATSALTRRSS
jgi:low temperature requirement protein LtrA